MAQMRAATVLSTSLVVAGLTAGIAVALVPSPDASPTPLRVAVARPAVTRAPVVPPEEARATLDAPPGSRLVLWGDSLASEAAQPFLDSVRFHTGGRVEVAARTLGGTAVCDWLTEIVIQAGQGPITAAVLEFSGNALTVCMRGPDGAALRGDAYIERYRTSTLAAIRALRGAGARVYIVSAPVGPAERVRGEASRLRSLYRGLARQHDEVFFVDAGASVLTPAGEWTATLPCLPDEGPGSGCAGGRIDVRAPDGVHFCPGSGPAASGVTGTCPHYSSGAMRYGRALAQPLIDDLRIVAAT